MKIAYLIHYSEKNFEEITENLDQIIDAGDDCYVIINDNDLRDDILLSYSGEPRMRLCHTIDAVLPGDLSMIRGQILQIKDALEFEEEEGFQYDYFINLSDGMLPIKKREELIAYLEQHKGEDIYYTLDDSNSNPDLEKRFEEYAFFTNAYDFQKSKMIRGMNKVTANIVHSFKQRKIDDTLVLTYPWFILTHESAKILADNLGYCSDVFKMTLYPEELVIGTMLRKFSNVKHHNENIWVANEDGSYKLESPIENVSLDAIKNHPNAFFATKIHSDDNFDIYQDYFDIYNDTENVEN